VLLLLACLAAGFNGRALGHSVFAVRGWARASPWAGSIAVDAIWRPNTLSELLATFRPGRSPLVREAVLIHSHLAALESGLGSRAASTNTTVVYWPTDPPFIPDAAAGRGGSSGAWCPTDCSWHGAKTGAQAASAVHGAIAAGRSVALVLGLDRSNVGEVTVPPGVPQWVPRLAASMENHLRVRGGTESSRPRSAVPRLDASVDHSLASAVPTPYLGVNALLTSATADREARRRLVAEARLAIGAASRLADAPGRPARRAQTAHVGSPAAAGQPASAARSAPKGPPSATGRTSTPARTLGLAGPARRGLSGDSGPTVPLGALLRVPPARPPAWGRRAAAAASVSNCGNAGVVPDRLAFLAELRRHYPLHQYGYCLRERTHERWLPLSDTQTRALAAGTGGAGAAAFEAALASLPPPPVQTADEEVVASLARRDAEAGPPAVAPAVVAPFPVVPLCDAIGAPADDGEAVALAADDPSWASMRRGVESWAAGKACAWHPDSLEPPNRMRAALRAAASTHDACSSASNPDRRLPRWAFLAASGGSGPAMVPVTAAGGGSMGVGARCDALLRLVVEAELYREEQAEEGAGGAAETDSGGDPVSAALRGAAASWSGHPVTETLASAFRWASAPKGIVEGFLSEGRGLWSKQAVMAGYRYAVAMENSASTDYVTEKPYDALRAGAVPLYFGAPAASALLPPGSVLDLRRVESAERLASGLRAIDAAPPLAIFLASAGWRLRPLPVHGPFSPALLFLALGSLPPSAGAQASAQDGVTSACRVCMCVAGLLPHCRGIAAAARGDKAAAAEVLGAPPPPETVRQASLGETEGLRAMAEPLASLAGLLVPEVGRDVAPRPEVATGTSFWWTAAT